MVICLKSNPTKFHPNPIGNDNSPRHLWTALLQQEEEEEEKE